MLCWALRALDLVQVLKVLFGEINYGGRVTDHLDRRTLMTLLDVFMLPEVLDPHYKFSPSGKYGTIEAEDKAGYLAYINSFELNAQPEVRVRLEASAIKSN